jgi:hypothetical protein
MHLYLSQQDWHSSKAQGHGTGFGRKEKGGRAQEGAIKDTEL